MPANVDIVKRVNKAAQEKDFETVKSLLHPQYTLKDPMVQFNSAQEFIDAMQNCPFTCTLENASFIAEGDKVVQTLDMVSTAPVAYRSRVCSIITLENGKIRSEEMFYDTASIPKEALEIAKNSLKDKKAA